MTDIKKAIPPQFSPGPVDGVALNRAFVLLYRDVLSQMDIPAANLPVFTASVAGIVPASGGGTVKFIRADGAWAIPPTLSSAAPTAKVGTTAVNGSASTFMRSDSAPPIDQSLAPTWTGTHTFTPSAGNAQVINGPAAGTAVVVVNTQAKTGAQTITITLTNFPGTNSGAKTPTYIPVTIDGSKYWIQALPD